MTDPTSDPDTPLPFGERGKLEYDEINDALVCHLCGRLCRNLAQHARLTHNLTADEYRELAGLNHSTRLMAPGLLARLSEIARPMIERLRSQGKLKRWDEDPERLATAKALAEEVIRQGLSAEARRHGAEGWTPERRAQRAESTRRRNLSGELRASPAAIGAGMKRHYAEHPESIQVERLRRQAQVLKERGMPLRQKTCVRCGAGFETRCTRGKYCPACRPVATREYNTRWRRNKRAARQRYED